MAEKPGEKVFHSFENAADHFEKQLFEKMYGQAQGPLQESQEWLRVLYKTYSERSTADNQLIWTTGSILLPLSLGLFAAIPNVATWYQLLALACASVFLILFWNLIADNHRSARLQWEARLTAIERVIAKSAACDNSKKLNDLVRARAVKESWWVRFTTAVKVGSLRWLLAHWILCGWVAILGKWRLFIPGPP